MPTPAKKEPTQSPAARAPAAAAPQSAVQAPAQQQGQAAAQRQYMGQLAKTEKAEPGKAAAPEAKTHTKAPKPPAKMGSTNPVVMNLMLRMLAGQSTPCASPRRGASGPATPPSPRPRARPRRRSS